MNSSVIKGDAISDFCMMHGGMLNFDIYDVTENDVPDAIKPYIAINKSHWEKHPDIQADDDDGYRCCLYLPKNRGENGVGACPPVMVYRGSDMEESDIEKLVMGMQGSFNFLLDLPSFPRVPDDIAFSESIDKSAGLLPSLMGMSMATLKARSDLYEETMFTNVSGQEAFTVGLPFFLRDGRATLDWTLNTSLFYGLSGDWPVNFAQGLGRVPPQYTKAIRDGRLAAEVTATEEWGYQVIFTGHSLGGGLASAGSIAARTLKPDLRIRATTYNAAGLHEKTANTIPALETAPSNVPIRANHIHSEILNSLQSETRIVPFLADLLAWANKQMPQAVPMPIAEQGISPGEMPILNLKVADEGRKMPKLFPVANEEMVNSGFPALGPIIAIASGANNVPVFIERLVAHLIDSISAGDTLHYTEAQELQNLTLPDMTALIEPLTNAALSGGPIPPISVGTSDYAVNTINPLVNGLLADTIGLARLFLASGNYHTFLPCAYTFLLPPE